MTKVVAGVAADLSSLHRVKEKDVIRSNIGKSVNNSSIYTALPHRRISILANGWYVSQRKRSRLDWF